jgi:hypothetical protein
LKDCCYGKIDQTQGWLLAVRIENDKCQSNLRNNNPKKPKTPQMDVLIDCSRKTVAAALNAMEVTRKIKYGTVENRIKGRLQVDIIHAKNISRVNKDLISIVYTYLIKIIQTMEASTHQSPNCCMSKYDQNVVKNRQHENKIGSIRRQQQCTTKTIKSKQFLVLTEYNRM